MTVIPPAVSDPHRLALLKSFGILDTGPEPGFDDVVMLARQICGTSVALVSLVDADRQWFKAASGFDACETPINQSICAHALAQHDVLVIPDLSQDLRTRDNPLVRGEPHIRFYAGAPLIAGERAVVGTVCVVDTVARPEGLAPEQIAALQALARQVMTQLEQRRAIVLHDARARQLESEAREREAAQAAQRDSEARYRLLFNSLDAGFCVIEVAFDDAAVAQDYRFIEINAAFINQTGLHDAAGKWVRDLVPDHEQHWFDLYGRVALTGEAMRFEQHARERDDRWYDVHAFRIGAPGAHQVAVLFNDVSERRNAQHQQALLNDELGHRIKNSMALVQAIASQTLRGVTDRAAVQAFTQRITALSHANDILLRQSWSSADLRDVVRGVLSAHAEADRIRLKGPAISLDPKAALSLSLLLHELATNAVKYGALSVPAGHVAVTWSTVDAELHLTWAEIGGPLVTPPARSGLGTRLIDTGIVGTADVTKRYDPTGFVAEFRAPLERIEHRAG